MNTTMRNRLIGLAIVLIVLFMLSWLIPGHQPATDEHSIPVSAIPVGSASVATESNAAAPGQATAANPAAGGIVSADGGSIHTQPYESAGASGTSADNEKNKIGTAQAASQPGAQQSKPEPSAKTPVATKAVTAAPTAAASADTYVQIGSYSENDNAHKILSSLQKNGFRGRIEAVAIKGKTLYRVRVGPFADKDAASQVQKQIAAKGYKGTRVLSGR